MNETFTFEPKPIFEVAVRAADGRAETYRATGNHPFWIENSSEETGWTAAEDLQTGDTLRLADGSAASVISLTETGTNEPVYNMDVDGWHTYHVGILGTWVHNMNCPVAAASPALRGDPYHPDVVASRIKPEFRPNPAHNPGSNSFNPRKSPEPADSLAVYQNADRVGLGTWVGKSDNGQYYQFFSDNAGGVHFADVLDNAALTRYGIRVR